jgi:hypothetical protein
MKAFAIRDKNTKLYLTAKRGSFTFDEPKQGTPRLHLTKRSAQNTLTTWLLGYVDWHTTPTSYDPFNGDYDGGEVIRQYTKKEHRKRENMEIVEFDLVEVKS